MKILEKIHKAYDRLKTIAKNEILRKHPVLFGRVYFRKGLATILLTARCNSKCVMCNQWMEEKKEELLDKEIINAITELSVLGFKEIHFTGGEPLLRKGLLRLVGYARGLGMTVGMTTNGCLLTAEKLNELIIAGISSIAVSVDATESAYKNIRGIDAYKQAERAVSLVSEYKKKTGLIAYINFTLMKPSIGYYVDVKKLAEQYDLPIAICLLDDTPYFFKNMDNKDKFWLNESDGAFQEFISAIKQQMKESPGSLILSKSGISYIEKYFSDPVRKDIPCVVSQKRIFIDPEGNIYGGCYAMGSFGNVKTSKLKDVINSDKLRRSEKNMYYKNCPGCSCGYLNNLQHNLPALIFDLFKRGA